MSATELLRARGRILRPGARLLIFCLFLAGCGVRQPTTTVRTTPPPKTGMKSRQVVVPATGPSEPPAKPSQPAPQPSPRLSETRPPPATTSKGAQKLMAWLPAVPVRARERTSPPVKPPVPQTSIKEDSGTVTGAVVQELVIKGPPPQLRPPRSGTKAFLWLGSGLGLAALAVLARVCVIRRTKPAGSSEGGKDDLRMPRELGFKEPVGTADS
jgi:hypothetical protein